MKPKGHALSFQYAFIAQIDTVPARDTKSRHRHEPMARRAPPQGGGAGDGTRTRNLLITNQRLITANRLKIKKF